jgi:hypothetical protein
MSQLTRRGAIVADQDSPRFEVTFRASGSITDPDLFLQPSFMGDEIPAFVADTRIALAPYGVVGSDLTRFKRKANDARRPYDLGRHAPDAGADLRTLDLRRVVGDSASARDSESEGVFRASWIVVRQAIDAYFAYLQVSVG